jgi:hypothetical protein
VLSCRSLIISKLKLLLQLQHCRLNQRLSCLQGFSSVCASLWLIIIIIKLPH